MLARFLVPTIALMLAGCAPQPNAPASGAMEVATTPICDSFLDKASRLNEDVRSIQRAPECIVLHDNSGQKFDVLFARGTVNPRAANINAGVIQGLDVGFAPRLLVLIIRSRDSANLPDTDFSNWGLSSSNWDLKPLNRTVAVRQSNSASDLVGTIISLTESDTKIVWACVQADGTSRQNTPTRAFICRSVTKMLTDETIVMQALVAQAESIGIKDYPALTP